MIRPLMFLRPVSSPALRRASSIVFSSGLALAWGCGDPLDELDGNDTPSFTAIYESDEFQTCSECHAPNAPGRVDGIEATQDWSTRDRALATLRGAASGLIGNFEACNGVALLGASAEQSLLVASFDLDVRMNFSSASAPDCTGDAIADQTLQLGRSLPAGLLQDLKDWIDAGAPGN
jgi:hypothetical protein